MARIDSHEVEIAYADSAQQFSALLRVPVGTSLRGVIERARLCERFPDIDLAVNRVGVFGVLCDLETVVQAGDRVEVYRPLTFDPKVARRMRGNRKK